MNIEKILNEVREYIKNNPNSNIYEFLSFNNYTQQALGTHEYNFLVRQLSKKFGDDEDSIKLFDQLN